MRNTVQNIFGCLFTLSFISAQDPVVNLPQGRIVGIKVYTDNSLTPVEIYFGVPYATSPIGRYRFSAPEKHTGWRRTFFAHRLPPHCPHDVGRNENDGNFSEDCLFLNIWTPRHSDGNALPVVVILYSESWTQSGVALPCQELASEGVVVVTVAYRLHLLAFFTLRSMSARGNLALLDQYLALLWIRGNIAAFGGDPQAITLLGHSGGADSVLHHILSPRSIGLFQRAIIMSPRDIWKVIDDQSYVDAAEVERISREMARSLGCNNNADQEILHCMRAQSLADISLLFSNANWSKVMQPVAETYLPESEQYLPISLPMALSATKQPITQIDLLLGTTDLEVLNYNDETYEVLMKQNPSYVSEYADAKVIPELLRTFSLHQSEILTMLIQVVRWEYWSMKTKKNVEVLDAVEFLARIESSAKWGAGGALLAARLARRVARLYVYRFSQPAGVDLYGRQLNVTGAVHGSDLVSLLGDALMLQVARRPATADEKALSVLFRRYFINFIKHGSPGEENTWQRYKAGDAHIYDIRDTKTAGSNQHSASKEVKFWLQYLPKLFSLLTSVEQTGQLTSGEGESRLRGGVFAMCGVSVVLLLMLCACVILLHRQRSHRHFSVADESHN